MPDNQRFGVPMKLGLELSPVVGLQDQDTKGQSLSNLVQEADGRALLAGIVNLQYPDTGAIIDGGELIQALTRPRDALKELHVHLQAVSGLRLLVPFPAFAVRPVLLVGG
jgi:hypothetical protein